MSESPISSRGLLALRPTVRLGGAENVRVTSLLQRLEVLEQEDGFSRMELNVLNTASDRVGGADFAFEDEHALKLGERITVYSGDETSPREIFNGLITGLEAEFSSEGPPLLTALAEDGLQGARMKRRTRTHEKLKLSDLANSLAGDLGLTPRVSGFTTSIGTQVQLNESDLAFLRRLLGRYDGDLQVVGHELHVSPRGEVRRGTVELSMNSQLRRAQVLADLSHQVSEVTVTGWDARHGKSIKGQSRGAHTGPGTGRTGSEILSRTLGRRPHQLGHLAVASGAEANAVAESAFDERQRRFVTVQATATGNPSIRVGTHVRLTGLGPRFSNTYYVTRCCHRFDLADGYETDFSGECAFLGRP